MRYKFTIVINGELKRFSDNDRYVLLGHVAEFLKKNNINYSDADLLKRIDRQSKLQDIPSRKRLSFGSALSGAKALLKYTSGSTVSIQEMYRRSEICDKCPLSTKVSDCMGCGAAGNIAKAVNAIRALKKTEAPIPSSIKNKYCGFCGCSIPLMVVTELKDFHPEQDSKNQTRPDTCWLKKTSINYTNESTQAS